MYRGIAHSGLSRIPTSRHVPIRMNPSCSCRKLSLTAVLGKKSLWMFRGGKSQRNKAQQQQKSFENTVKDRQNDRQEGPDRNKVFREPISWESVPPPAVNWGSPVDFRSKPPTEGTALTGPGKSFMRGKDWQIKESKEKPTEAPASAVLNRQKFDPRAARWAGSQNRDLVDTTPPPRISFATSMPGEGPPWPAETKKASWESNPVKIRPHFSSGTNYQDPFLAKEAEKRQARATRLPTFTAIAGKPFSDQDYHHNSSKWPQQAYSPLDGELEPWEGEPSELAEPESKSRERRQYLAEYDGRPPFRAYEDFESFSRGDEREITILKKAPKVLPYSSPTSEFLYGYNICRLALKEKKRKIYTLYVYTGLMRQSGTIEKEGILRKLAEGSGVTVETTMDVSLLDAMSKGRPHNGFAIEAEPLDVPKVKYLTSPDKHGKFQAPFFNGIRYVEIEAKQKDRKPFVLVLDEVLDGGNFGAILRSAYFLGVDAVFIVSKNSTPATAVTSRASAGALECIDYYDVGNLATFIEESRQRNWKFFGAMPAPSQRELKAARSNKSTKWYDMEGLGDPTAKYPVALVLGNEAEGLRPKIQAMMNAFVTIRKGDHVDAVVDSLNVGVAASILTHAFLYPAVKGTAPVPAKDRRSERRENEAAMEGNMLFEVDDGKYKAPRYEGTKPVAAETAAGAAKAAMMQKTMLDDEDIQQALSKGWQTGSSATAGDEDEDAEEGLSEDESDLEDEVERLEEDEDDWEDEPGLLSDDESDDEDSDDLGEAEDLDLEDFEELEGEERKFQEGEAVEAVDEAEDDLLGLDGDWGQKEAAEATNKSEVTSSQVGEDGATYSPGREESKETTNGLPVEKQDPLVSSASLATNKDSLSDSLTTKAADESSDDRNWEDVYEMVEEGQDPQLQLQKGLENGTDSDAIKPEDTDLAAGFVGPVPPIVESPNSSHRNNTDPEIAAIIAKKAAQSPEPKKKKKQATYPPLPKRLQEIADMKGLVIKGTPTKKQKKVLKKEGKKLQQELRRKVREDASRVRQALNKKSDPDVLKEVKARIDGRNMAVASENKEAKKKIGNGKTKAEKAKNFDYVKAGEWKISEALE